MMDDFDDIGPHSWRSLQPRATTVASSTPVVRRRRLRAAVRWAYGVCILGLLLLGVAWEIKYLRGHPQWLHMGEPLQPVRQLDFATNGVLTRAWAESFIGLEGLGQREPDVNILREKLLSVGQVRSAQVERQWPDILKIRIKEEEPVARLMAGVPGRGNVAYLVSRRGRVYEGSGYAQATLAELPWLDGVVLRRDGRGGYQEIPGMRTVAQLLDEASLRLPNLRAQWRVVSLEDFEGRTDVPWAVIRVRCDSIEQIVFAPRDFARQLDALATAVNDFAVKNQKIRRIDLSMDDLGVAQLAEPLPEAPKPKRADKTQTPIRLLPPAR